MRSAEKNVARGEKVRFKLPRTPIPEPIMRGVKGWQTRDGWTVVRLHYTADEEVDDDWIKERSVGYRGGIEGRDWQREMEIAFDSYSGEAVYPRFDPACIRPTPYNPELELWRGWDFGFRHPAVVFVQYDPEEDRLNFLHEVYPTLNTAETPGINTHSLCALIRDETTRLFPEVAAGESPVRDFVDPAGNQHKETSDYSSIEIMSSYGMDPEWTVLGRKNRITYARHWVEGGPERMSLNPHCVLSAKAFSKAYRYPEERKGGIDRDLPDLSKRVQNEPYIHLIDAFEYIVANVLQYDEVADPTAWSRNEQQDQLIGDLAEMYLQASRHAPVSASPTVASDDHWSDYENRLSDFVGEDDLADAFMIE